MFVRNNDANVFIDVRGEGSAVVFLHGFPFTHDIWADLIAATEKSHRVVAPDLRGMGQSSVTAGPYLMEVLAGDVAAGLDALMIDRAIFIGHSLGGYVALTFARMFAERVTALALMCSRLAADSGEQAAARELLATRLESENSIEPAIEAYLPRFFSARSRKERPEIVERATRIARNNDPFGAAAILRGMALRGASEDIASELQMPVLVIAGRTDALVPAGEAEAIAAAFPNAQLAWCEHSAHMPMLEEPDLVRETVTRFVRSATA